MMLWPGCFYLVLAFLSGSVPWSWILGRLKGIDIRREGSGNAGATNLLRVCGRTVGITGLLLDILKGAFPVFAAYRGLFGIIPPADTLVASFAAISAVLGHVFCPWLGFRGGKGVATAMGVLLVLSPMSVLSALVVFVVVLSISRYVSLGSICAAVTLVPAVFLFETDKIPVQVVMSAVAVLIILRHISNIKRLLSGKENRFSFGRTKNV